METYGIIQGGNQIGTVQVVQEGLYQRFSCRCDLSGEVMYQLMLQNGEETLCLGVLVPVENCFGVDTRLPRKRISTSGCLFYLKPRHGATEETFVPIRPETPFAYLHRLEQTFLAHRDGAVGLVLRDEKLR